MIYTNVKNCRDYLGIHENMDLALNYIATHNLADLPDGVTELKGSDVKIVISRPTTKPVSEGVMEAHEKFADIQMNLEGGEDMLVSFREIPHNPTTARPENDVWFFDGTGTLLHMDPGQIIIVLPDDLHGPTVTSGEPKEIRKAVIKVRVKD